MPFSNATVSLVVLVMVSLVVRFNTTVLALTLLSKL